MSADATNYVQYSVLNDYGYWSDTGYYYYVKDYQGNVRAVVDGSGMLEEINSYYPYGALMGGSKINLNDNSGRYFLNKMASDNITLDDYMKKAKTGSPYDFKSTNGDSKPIPNIDVYRGMPIGGKTSNGQLLISSARDIGNIAAGLVAAKNGIPWKAARIAFDTYQSKNNIDKGLHPGIERLSTQNAEYYGWSLMALHSDTHSEMHNLWNSIKHFLNGLFK